MDHVVKFLIFFIDLPALNRSKFDTQEWTVGCSSTLNLHFD